MGEDLRRSLLEVFSGRVSNFSGSSHFPASGSVVTGRGSARPAATDADLAGGSEIRLAGAEVRDELLEETDGVVVVSGVMVCLFSGFIASSTSMGVSGVADGCSI